MAAEPGSSPSRRVARWRFAAGPPGVGAGPPRALPALPAGADLAPLAVPVRWVTLLCLLTFVVYLIFVPQIIRYSSPPTGDQPFYYVQFTHVVGDGPRSGSPRGVTYGPDNTLYVLDGNTLFAYRVTH